MINVFKTLTFYVLLHFFIFYEKLKVKEKLAEFLCLLHMLPKPYTYATYAKPGCPQAIAKSQAVWKKSLPSP